MTHATYTQIDAQTLRNRQTNSEHNKTKQKITNTNHKNFAQKSVCLFSVFVCAILSSIHRRKANNMNMK